jgi:formylglycine-generating enzyme required for sulfatase activity
MILAMLLVLSWGGCDFIWPLETPFVYVQLKGGTFQMGSPEDEPCHRSSESLHEVTLTRGFEISSIEVTQGQFQELMEYNPSRNSSCGEMCPVEQVSWDEAAAYCNALSAKNGLERCYACSGKAAAARCRETSTFADNKIYLCPGYRLPTEAEWEYAYRAGTQTAYYMGENSSCEGNDSLANHIGWYAPAAGSTQPSAMKRANAQGLFDMAGNVWEWVLRGGSWDSDAETLRAAYRYHTSAVHRRDIGFRCVKSR